MLPTGALFSKKKKEKDNKDNKDNKDQDKLRENGEDSELITDESLVNTSLDSDKSPAGKKDKKKEEKERKEQEKREKERLEKERKEKLEKEKKDKEGTKEKIKIKVCWVCVLNFVCLSLFLLHFIDFTLYLQPLRLVAVSSRYGSCTSLSILYINSFILILSKINELMVCHLHLKVILF